MVLLFQKLNHSFQITMYSYFFLTPSQFPWPHGILRSVQLDSESVRPLRFGGELWGMTPPKKKTENPNVMNIEVLISIWFLQYIYIPYINCIHLNRIYIWLLYMNNVSILIHDHSELKHDGTTAQADNGITTAMGSPTKKSVCFGKGFWG